MGFILLPFQACLQLTQHGVNRSVKLIYMHAILYCIYVYLCYIYIEILILNK